MKTVYFSHNGRIISHEVVHETEDYFWIDKVADGSNALLPLDKDLLGVKAFEDFEEAKKARREDIEKLIEKLNEEIENIENQEVALNGNIIVKEDKE